MRNKTIKGIKSRIQAETAALNEKEMQARITELIAEDRQLKNTKLAEQNNLIGEIIEQIRQETAASVEEINKQGDKNLQKQTATIDKILDDADKSSTQKMYENLIPEEELIF